jgi:hypothetical protein
MKQKNKTQGKSAFDRLFREAFEDDFLNQGSSDEGGEDIVDDYENEISPIEGEEEGGEDVTITISADQVAVLKDILSQLEGGEEEEEFEDEGEGEGFDEFGDEGDEDVTDIEELEREAVEFEKAPDAESVRTKTKSGKASTKTGELDRDSSAQDTEEKQYKFVKRVKPTEHKTKTTKGSSGEKAPV